ncbi:Elp3 domain-containing protein [Meloidogyne graminicola]|uniref:DNA-directed RNA polymerase III subunit n=1 Tax=Meloidogyne graminicola TaxID=189291 RepID=A0A8S9ZRZ4_9BILA|nr:Elp3 domain-containing protein [Meloidogyne graminicola]
MSRGGRGASSSGVRAIANVLGISRQDVSQYNAQQVRNEPLPLYPPLDKIPLPLEETKELSFMVDTKLEFLNRFRDSPFYSKRIGKRDVRRYTDKYKLIDKETFEPRKNWNRLPAELNWKTKSKTNNIQSAKRAKIDENAVLERLGEREIHPQDDDEIETTQKPTNEEDEEVEYSDEDYLAEDANDYIETYFDGGEDYGDEGGNALEEEGTY